MRQILLNAIDKIDFRSKVNKSTDSDVRLLFNLILDAYAGESGLLQKHRNIAIPISYIGIHEANRKEKNGGLQNNIYDITNYLKEHPGGKDILESLSKTKEDSKELYRSIHNKGSSADAILQKLFIGKCSSTFFHMANRGDQKIVNENSNCLHVTILSKL